MHYLILFLLFFTFPANAQFSFGKEASKPNHMVVAGNSVIDNTKDDISDSTSPEKEEFKITDDITNDTYETSIPYEPTKPIAPTPPKISTKKVLKKIPLAKAKRSINDDRIDDSYVQKLIRDNFNFTHKID